MDVDEEMEAQADLKRKEIEEDFLEAKRDEEMDYVNR